MANPEDDLTRFTVINNNITKERRHAVREDTHKAFRYKNIK